MVHNEDLLADFWRNMPKNDKDIFITTGDLPEDAEIELLRMNLDTTDLQEYLENLRDAGDDWFTEEQPEEQIAQEEVSQEVFFETQEVTPQHIVEEIKTETKVSEKPKKEDKGKRQREN